jgi:hypothetical protein
MTLRSLGISGFVNISWCFPKLTELDLSINKVSGLSVFEDSHELISVDISSNPHLGWNRNAPLLENWLLLRSFSAQNVSADVFFLVAAVTAVFRPWPRAHAPLYMVFAAYLAVASAAFFRTMHLDL